MSPRSTPLDVRVDQMLTEARVIIPGAQALFGFQLAVTFQKSFGALPETAKTTHVVSLGMVALAIILLMAPAAIHRIAFRGEERERLHTMGSAMIVAATLPLALGLAGDIYVGVVKAIHSEVIAVGAAAVAFVLLAVFWYALPILARRDLH